MSWSTSELKRSYPCNPELIKFLRTRKNWSQRRLAKESGYCERLICKAESGGSIASATIEVLAKALSTKDLKVFPEDLISDPIALSKKFIEAVHTLERDFVKGVAHFIDPSGEFNFVQCAIEEYGGNYKGIVTLNDAAGRFFDALKFVKNQDFHSNYRYYGDGNDVVAWGKSAMVELKTDQTFNLSITLRLSFQRGKLFRIEDRSKILSV